jgi:hypothetical protein
MFVQSLSLSKVAKAALQVAALLLLLLSPLALHTAMAQSATAGAISGTISDANGALLPNTVVTVVSTETGATRTVKSNSSGEYRVTDLEPGTYKATFIADGFQTRLEDNIVVTVGSISALSPKLAVGSVSDKVEVSDETPLLHLQDNAVSTTIDQDAIDNLPINGRRWSSFALLTPGVVSNGDGFGLLSFRGISFLLNNNTVDGADNNQAYFSEERGRTRAAYTISQAAVQEFQVNSSNYSAEYGRAAGGVINTVTKAGGNQFHGELFFYDRDNDFGASNPYTQLVTQTPGTNNFVATNYKPKDWRKQYGFGVGGYLIKDKLFWFYSYDESRRNFPGTARASDPSATFAPADSVLPTGSTCTLDVGSASTSGIFSSASGAAPGDSAVCSLAAALRLQGSGIASASTIQAASAYYAQGLGIISSFLGAVPRTAYQGLNFPRIDYQINDRNRLTLEYNRLRYDSPAGIQSQASNFDGRATFGNAFAKTDFGLMRLTTVLNNSMVNEFRAQYGRDLEFATSQKPLPNELPLSANQFNLPVGASLGYEFDLSGFSIGTPYLFPESALPDERRIQISDGITWSHGNHTTKYGVDINRVFEHVNNLYQGVGQYSYDYSWDFIADYLHKTEGLGTANYTDQYYTFEQGIGNPSIAFATTDYDGYISDDWRISPRLTLTAGIRYEYEYIPPNPYPNTAGNSFAAITQATTMQATALPQTADRPDDRNNFGPRVGFAFNVFGDGNTTLRGGYGMYYGRIIGATIANTYQASGAPNALTTVEFAGSDCASNSMSLFPGIFPSSESAAAAPIVAANCSPYAPTAAYLDPHMQNPQVHEADLALEQNLGWKTVFSLTYMMSLGRELPSVYDKNAPDTGNTTVTYTVRNDLTTTASGGVTGTVLPRGGHKPPLLQGTTHTYKLYSGARPIAAYYQIYEVQSEINSSYNALAVQLNKRFDGGLSFLSNFTWAHGMDYNPYLGTSFGTSSYLPVDPEDKRQDYGNSDLNVNKRFVFAAHYNPKFNFRGYKKYLLEGWGIAPIVQVQTGLPYSATTSGTQTGEAGSGPLGAGGAARLPKYDYYGHLETERNIFSQPKTADFDLRVGKDFTYDAFGKHLRFEVFAELFNTLNHQNITSVNTGSYTICNRQAAAGVVGGCPTSGTDLLIYNANFGTYNNSNSNATYTPRQLQIAGRLHF